MRKYFKLYATIGIVIYVISVIAFLIFIVKHSSLMNFMDWVIFVEYLLFAPAIYFLFLDHIRLMDKVDGKEEKNNKNDNQDSVNIGDEVILKFDCNDDSNKKFIPKNSLGKVIKNNYPYLEVEFIIDGQKYILNKLYGYFIKINN